LPGAILLQEFEADVYTGDPVGQDKYNNQVDGEQEAYHSIQKQKCIT
jgi:hypothetical protein